MSERTLQGKTIFITGASRGIGKAIALRAARDGAQVVIAAKTAEEHPRLPGTIYTAAEEVRQAGGDPFAVQMDLRFVDQIEAAVSRTILKFGGIDILVNNASALFLAGTLDTPLKRYDLLQSVNVRGTYMASRLCLPHLLDAENPHILNIAPPLNLAPHWFGPHVAYSISKMGMSLCTLGMAEEFREQGVAVNSLWPKTAIATAAVRNLLGGEKAIQCCRKPDIMSDAAHAVLTRSSQETTGNFFLDEEVLREEGVTDFDQYAVDPSAELMPDFFV